MVNILFLSPVFYSEIGYNGLAMVSLWNCPRGPFRENQAIIAR